MADIPQRHRLFPREMKQISNQPEPEALTRHQYEISALVSFRGEISGGIAKCHLYSWKTLDNNDLNQVLVKTRVWVGCSVSRTHKT